jgi:PAS domain S-box-containing protein
MDRGSDANHAALPSNALARRLVWWAPVAAAIAYFVLARWGLVFAASEGEPSPIWPANGVALAAAFWLSWRGGLAVLIAGVCANLLHPHPPGAAALYATVNAGSTLLGGLLLRGRVPWMRVAAIEPGMGRTVDAVRLALVCAGTAALGGMTVAVAAGGEIGWRSIFSTWTAGDALGQLALAPLLIALPTLGLPATARGRALMGIGAAAVPLAAAARYWPEADIGLPQQMITGAGVLAAFLGGVRAVSLAMPLTMLVAVEGWRRAGVPLSIDDLQFAMFFSGMVSLLVASTVAQRDRSAGAARDAAAAREARKRLEEMADAMPQLVWRATPEGVPDYYNARVEQFEGFSRDPSSGAWTWQPCVHPDDLARTLETWGRALRTGEAYLCEHRIRLRAENGVPGEYRWMLSRGEPVRDASGRIVHWYGTATDIDALKSAEAALRESEDRLTREVEKRGAEIKRMATQQAMLDRMAAVGTLAAGLGHDLGNLLLPIGVSADVLESEAKDPQTRAAAASIKRSMEYVRSLVKGLRLFTLGAHRAGTPRSTDPAEWAAQTRPFFSHATATAGRRVRLEMVVDPGTPAIGIDPASLSQAVLNLVQNAADALAEAPPEDGEDREWRVSVKVGRSDSCSGVSVVVEDDGPGMSPEVLARCAEPYYTTKTRGVRTGTGLGLALVHETVRRVGGSCVIDSELGRGTRVTLRLPRAENGASGTASALTALVEIGDEPVRRAICGVLVAGGYRLAGPGDSRPAVAVVDRSARTSQQLAVLISRVGPGRVVVLDGSGGSLPGATMVDPRAGLGVVLAAVRQASGRARAGEGATVAAPAPG